ncbi:MAG: SOS response-associated peptidase [Solirubrobacteraceae bacterium]|nr:SOS response-associated peptidase [Solirubrobacteraceae bacterium]
MCGRYRTKDTDPEEFSSRFGAYGPALADALGQIQLRPTDPVAIVRTDPETGERVAEAVRWGMQPPRSKRPLINARDDKLLSSGLWSGLTRNPATRILIPADGWYEWLSAEDPKAKKQAFLHRVDGGGPFAMAGLLGYAIVKDQKVPAATIITTDSAAEAAEIHDRMPVVLGSPEAEEAWLRAPGDASLIDALCVALEPGRVELRPATL